MPEPKQLDIIDQAQTLPAVPHAPATNVVTGEESRAIDLPTKPWLPVPDIDEDVVKAIQGPIAKIIKSIGVVSKRGVNQFHNYKYASISDVLSKLSPLLGKYSIVINQSEVERSMFDRGRCIAVKYAFTISNGEAGKVWPMRELITGTSRCMDSRGNFDDKAFNKCHTAARKYFLMALFQIVTGEEDDADHEPREPRRPVPKHDPNGVILNDEIPDFGDPGSAPPAESHPDKAGAPPHQDQPRSGASAETQSERIVRLDNELSAAAEGGSDELRRAWQLIPHQDRIGLEPALRKRHKPRAQEIDDAREP